MFEFFNNDYQCERLIADLWSLQKVDEREKNRLEERITGIFSGSIFYKHATLDQMLVVVKGLDSVNQKLTSPAERANLAEVKEVAYQALMGSRQIESLAKLFSADDYTRLDFCWETMEIDDPVVIKSIVFKCLEKGKGSLKNFEFLIKKIKDPNILMDIFFKCLEKREKRAVIDFFTDNDLYYTSRILFPALSKEDPEFFFKTLSSGAYGCSKIYSILNSMDPSILNDIVFKCVEEGEGGLDNYAWLIRKIKDPNILMDIFLKYLEKRGKKDPYLVAGEISFWGKLGIEIKLEEITEKCPNFSKNLELLDWLRIREEIKANKRIEEGTLSLLRAVSQRSTTQKVEIPDLAEFEEVPYGSLRALFAQFTDEELSGIKGINEKVLTPENHRESFEYFLSIVEGNISITGTTQSNAHEKYEPFRRIIKHLVKRLPDFDRSTQISVLSQFSTIVRGFCIDPYLKSIKFAYNLIKDESAEAASTQTPIEKLQEGLRARLLVVRDTQFNDTVRNKPGSPIDTHSENWAQNVLAEAGYPLNADDIHLEHGRIELINSLRASGVKVSNRAELVQYLTEEFRKRLVERCFEGFSKVIEAVLAQASSPSVSGSKEEAKITSATLSEYFDQLLSNHVAALLKSKRSAGGDSVDRYIAAKRNLPQEQRKLTVLEAKEKQIGSRIEARIKNKSHVEDLKEQQIEMQQELAEVQKKIEAITKALRELSSTLGADLCKDLDAIYQESEEMKKLWQNDWMLIDEDDYSIKIAIQGLWKFFNLFMDDEIRSIERAED